MEITICESCKKLKEDIRRLRHQLECPNTRQIHDTRITRQFFIRPSDLAKFIDEIDRGFSGPELKGSRGEFNIYVFEIWRSEHLRLQGFAQDMAASCK